MGLIIFDFNRTLFNPEENKLDEKAILVLTELKKRGHKLILVGKGGYERKKLISGLGIESFFDFIDIREEKSPEQFEQAIKKFIGNKQAIYSIGDRVKKEIKFSNQLGLNTIWLKKGKFENELPENESEKPNYTITNILDVLEIIK